MSPYDAKYLDVKFIGDVSGPVTLTVEDGIVSPPTPWKRKYLHSIFFDCLWTMTIGFILYVQIFSGGA